MVDDDIDDREIFREALAIVNPSLKLYFADNGSDAMKKLETSAEIPDIIFSDINMPIMNGIQFLEEIKKSTRLSSLPVVMYTTSSSANNESQCQTLGAEHYIIKPTRFERICHEIRFSLEKIANLYSRSVNLKPSFSNSRKY